MTTTFFVVAAMSAAFILIALLDVFIQVWNKYRDD